MNNHSPLLRVDEAANLVFPGKPYRSVRRQLYRWLREGIIPKTIVLRDGRAIWLRRGLLETWLQGQATDGSQEKIMP